MQHLLDLFRPNKTIDSRTWGLMIGVQIILAIGLWFGLSSELLPTPLEILRALKRLATEDILIQELFTSMWLSVQLMLIAIVISLGIAYATVMPFFRPFAFLVSKLSVMIAIGM